LEYAQNLVNLEPRYNIYTVTEDVLEDRIQLARILMDQAVVNYMAFLGMSQATISVPEMVFDKEITELYVRASSRISQYMNMDKEKMLRGNLLQLINLYSKEPQSMAKFDKI